MPLCVCNPAALCDHCYGRELLAKGGQARVLGEVWAESVCRGERRRFETWPEREPKTLAIALRKVERLTSDPRLRAELAAACSAGAAAWWRRRPARYREAT